MQTVDHLITDTRIATMIAEKGYGLIDKGAIGISNGSISWVGNAADAPDAKEVSTFGGRLITPALIDCHTHIVFGGNRAREFELRLEGASYEEVSRAGGGIRSTVAATRGTSQQDLVTDALTRLDQLIGEGVGTIEIKSGYGLDLETELKMLRAARQLQSERAIRVKTSFLGAHAIPAEYQDRSDAYIGFVCDEVLPAVHDEGLADAVDGFCEGIAFSPSQMRQVFERARQLGLPIKLHAEQLSDLGGAVMAAGMGALSADHLEYLNDTDAAVLAERGTVAVLLPGAFYTLRETRKPPVEALRAAGAAVAIATDCNPGSSPLTSLLLAMNMACTLFRLTPEEALAGTTRNAAKALGLGDQLGSVEPGKQADLAVWDVEEPAELAYRIGFNPLHLRIVAGQ